ncbi:predicted protein [Phaeodactylum tricornutum CCAP 1055/1]|jgi:hypothetical protein|uniref:JmjC domain-containing protein n=2 Tax=Phaeodactylum tricornutum TaxID=2850 RepID=B5Y548_PHATC|nr:predicted protein [Phaeodactylum tricornutum CCAP 1055/1]ACI65877.1 predicted protein [Phaeodactylum tricornutum CCAP 1055/1]|eukprot:XP_002186407.1 predicted protein [Phaeodactylum tricornutum CCAP 1055/1]
MKAATRRYAWSTVLILVVGRSFGWNWNPADDHPCNIVRLSFTDLYQRFGPDGVPPLHHEPLILVPDASVPGRNAYFRQRTLLQALPQNFEPNFLVTLSSSNSLSEHRRTVALKTYLNETVAKGETFPDRPSNESWYLFGETYSDEWKTLLKDYELPPCRTCTDEWVALSFGIGNRGSGVQWHVHGPGFSEAVHGRKHWILYPPYRKPVHDKDQSSRQWMEYVYAAASARPYECSRKYPCNASTNVSGYNIQSQ